MTNKMSEEAIDLVFIRHQSLERAAMVALRVGRVLMESGAKAEVVQQGASMVAKGLGAEEVYCRVGYASISMTLSAGFHTITRMMGVGGIGVNLQLNHGLRQLCSKVAKGGMTAAEVSEELTLLVERTRRHHWVVMALAAGIACASFGRLLGVDWHAVLPILLAGVVGQAMRYHLLRLGLNSFVMVGLVAFAAAGLSGYGAMLAGSATVKIAMSAAVLLLVPGVPVLNAQTDIMEGHPTLGSARAVTVLMVLVFMTVGVWLAEGVLGGGLKVVSLHHPGLWHQALFGAIAAAGFGILFNFGWLPLIWAGFAGALALSVRTLGLDIGWTLEVSSFVAAAAVGFSMHLLDLFPNRTTYAVNTLAVAGCIPMIPGSAAAQSIMGLLGLTAHPIDAEINLIATVEYGLTVFFTIGAIGTGLTIATHLMRRSEFA